MARGSLPRAPGAPGAGVKKIKNPYSLRGAFQAAKLLCTLQGLIDAKRSGDLERIAGELEQALPGRRLWMSLQLMWLQVEVVHGPVGVVWGRFAAGLAPKLAPN